MKNLKQLVYLRSIFGIDTFIAPILTLFYVKYVGLDFSNFLFLQSLSFALGALLEVPLGVVSDTIGRKKCLIVGEAVYILAMALLLVFPSPATAIVSCILFPLGSALSSGNFDAMVYEAFKSAGEEQDYLKISGRAYSLQLATAAIATVVGGWLGAVNLAFPMLLDVVFLAFSLGATIVLLSHTKTSLPTNTQSVRENLKSVVGGFRLLVHMPSVFALFLFLNALFAVSRANYFLYQPLFVDAGLKLSNFGYMFGIFALVSALSAHLFTKYRSRFATTSSRGALMLSLVLISLAPVIMGSSVAFVFSAILMQQMLRGIWGPIANFEINQQIPGGHPSRTSLLSVFYLLNSLVVSGVTALIGVSSHPLSHRATFIFNTAFLIVVASVSGAIFLTSLVQRSRHATA